MLRTRNLAVLAASSALFIATTARAQEADPSKPADTLEAGTAEETDSAVKKGDEIVVTGTVLRGVAPTGSNVISVSREDVTATGASTTSQLLATVPQIANMFNTLPQVPPGGGVQLQVLRPNLRNTPSDNLATGAATLILVDGHRIAGVGVRQSAPDPEAIPVGAIDRVEIVTDGGSSTYGADAIGGVINYITRRRFNGLQVEGRYGFADNYTTYDGNVTAGKDWGTGSIYGSYSYATHDDVLGRDRDYAKNIDWTTGIASGRQCTAPNIVVSRQTFVPPASLVTTSTIYAVPGLVAGTFNACDQSDFQALYPREERHSGMVGFAQDLNQSLKVDIRAFYTHREADSLNGPHRTSVNVPSTSAFYRNVAGPDAGRTQSVQFSFAPVFGNESFRTVNKYDSWGITPSVTADLDDNWQLRTMFNYSRSHSSYVANDLNPTLLSQYAQGTTADTAINPYDIAATPNKQLLQNLRNWEAAGESGDELINARAIVDGRLFALPGGEVRVAGGIEYMQDKFKMRFGGVPTGGLRNLAFRHYSRNVKSAFGEVQIPLFGPDNAMTGFHALNVGVSARYDDYSDFGSTFNPKVGVTWKPIEWVTLRGNWGKSFNAPTPVDQLGALSSTVGFQTFFFVVPPGQTGPGAGTAAVITLEGAANDLRPQTAKTWSVGAEIEPPFLPGLRASLSYYRILYRGTLSKPPVFNAQQMFANFPQFVTLNPTVAQVQAFGALASNPEAVAQFLAPGALPVYELLDFRTRNLGNTNLSGLDFSISYHQDTGFGSIDASINGNYQLDRETQASTIAPFTDDLLTGVSTFRVATSLGATIGNFRAQATLNHNSGYDVPVTAVGQIRVGSFDVVNLFFRYNVEGAGLLKDLAFTLNVGNVLDQDPPIYRNNGGSGFANGQTLGRMFQFGVTKKF